MRVFFFFQAEDGIRDKLVTGVHTCALPIWEHEAAHRTGAHGDPGICRVRRASSESGVGRWPRTEIGRASCRERVQISVVAVSLKKKKKKVGEQGELERKGRQVQG